jgi:acyl dehydratase
VQAAGTLGAYDPNRSLHASQRLELHRPLPREGVLEMAARVAKVWDKGKAALVEVVVECEFFTATYSLFLPGRGGFGGERGPGAGPRPDPAQPGFSRRCPTTPDQAALYRLTGDPHAIHVDPEVARANGFERPILHGLCTLGLAARVVACAAGAHPDQLRLLEARLAAPVMPGDVVEVLAHAREGAVEFSARVGETGVLQGGRARFDLGSG